MNNNRENLARELDGLSDDQLRQVADYVGFLKFQSRRTTMMALDSRIAGLYRDFAAEDRMLANSGLTEYRDMLRDEDRA